MPIRDEIKKGIACDSVGKPDSAIGRAVCLSVHPGKMLLYPFHHWFEFHYKGRHKFSRLIFSIDLLLIGIALALGMVALYTAFFLPRPFAERIVFEATVAPREVLTGAPSTLVIHYLNGTNEPLQNAKVSLTFPKHFLLQESSSLSLGTIPAHKSGTIHLKGVMFGDVGGEQAFQSKLTFLHGKLDAFGEKINLYTFSPMRSALTLSLELPDRLIPYQPIEGIVRYKNTSEIDFPIVSLLPQWPKGFVFTKANAPLRNNQFEVPSVKAGEQGEFRFTGVLQEAEEEVTFIFHPSFAFEDERYKQETLTHTAPVVALPIELTHTMSAQTFQPGSEISFEIQYKNTADFPLTDVLIGMESDHPFLKITNTETKKIIQPGEEGTITLTETVKTSLQQSELDSYEHLLIGTRPFAHYTMGDEAAQRVTSKGSVTQSRLNTPIRFESFARYKTPGGDQIGRGPVPPEVGEETTYWVFWHIGGTTNELNNVRIEATLPAGVRFTGRQTVSQNGSVAYDSEKQSVVWTSNLLPPTLSTTSKIVGVAFEVGLTPPVEINPLKPPTILKDIRLTATDDWTGSFVSASAKDIKAIIEK